ncbi:MAG: amino acid transporter [Comamonadaceae bacterium CG1_02_60_18]|nr:MAG: amino acid transporter [Comamonadaceae bacterium CG1_02_60_18]PIQ53686.1 MAG: amino acid transporter [Comamonadaceae bacterium CG12_big_fil_rev_8_21_14_0_65_59_15]
MLSDAGAGLATGLALIVAIGSQNAFVLRQGIQRQHVLALVLFCALSDALLIVTGIGGAGLLIRGNDTLLNATRYGGAAFLMLYGLLAVRRAVVGGQLSEPQSQGVPLASALAACFGFTFLNPHVYLDTVVLVGSLANQRGEVGRWFFGAGAVSASFLWFAALGYGARLLAPLFQRRAAWRWLDALIALTMWTLAFKLL